MLGLPPVYREDTARQHQSSFNANNGFPQQQSQGGAAGGGAAAAASSVVYATSAAATPAEAWVQRQLPFYEDRYTALKKATMLVTTFNVGCKPPPSREYLQLLVQKELLGKASYFGFDNNKQNATTTDGSTAAAAAAEQNVDPRYPTTTPMDFIVVGLQEVDMSAAALWKEETETARPWIFGFKDAVGADGGPDGLQGNLNPNNEYFMMPPKQLVGLLLLFFIRKPLGRFVEDVGITSVATGTMGTLGNKGCVAIRFQMHKSSYCIINAHLAAGQEHVVKRNDDMHTILTQLDFYNSSRGGGGGGGAASSAGPAAASPIVVNPSSSAPSTAGAGAGGGGGSGLNASLFPGGAGGQTGILTSPNQQFRNSQAASSFGGGNGNAMALQPQDHDLIIFLGDLNYRVDIGYAEGIQKAVEGDYDFLLRRDQLLREMTNPHTPFKGFTDHTPSKFPPTYRFDIGTNNYDTSEKKRIPAYTDRILHWSKNARHKSVYVLASEVKREIMSSDHKPYCCVLSVPYREEVPALRKQVEDELRSKVSSQASLDRVSAAKVSINVQQLDFGVCTHYTQRIEHSVTFTNEGECVAVITTSRASASGNSEKGDISGGLWLRCRPLNFEILPGETRTVTVECYLNRQSLAWMSRWEPFVGQGEKSLRSMLLFSIENGPLSAIECSVKVKPSVFCNSLSNMLKLNNVPCADAYRQSPNAKAEADAAAAGNTAAAAAAAALRSSASPSSSSAAASANNAALMAALPRIPKEIWFLCEAILRRGATEKDLFTSDTVWSDVASVMEFLDTHAEPIPQNLGSAYGLAQCLIDLLKNLQEPVIPFALYRTALNSTKNGKMPLQVVHEQLPAAHCNLFIYLIGFLRRLLMPNYVRLNELDASTLSQIFAKILLVRPPMVPPAEGGAAISESELRASIHQDQIDAAKFLQFFLGASGARS